MASFAVIHLSDAVWNSLLSCPSVRLSAIPAVILVSSYMYAVVGPYNGIAACPT